MALEFGRWLLLSTFVIQFDLFLLGILLALLVLFFEIGTVEKVAALAALYLLEILAHLLTGPCQNPLLKMTRDVGGNDWIVGFLGIEWAKDHLKRRNCGQRGQGGSYSWICKVIRTSLYIWHTLPNYWVIVYDKTDKITRAASTRSWGTAKSHTLLRRTTKKSSLSIHPE